MAARHHQQQPIILTTTICFITLLLLGDASGTGNTHVKENHNYTSVTGERTSWDIVGQQQQQRQHQQQQQPPQSNAIGLLPTQMELDDKNKLLQDFGSLKPLNVVKRAPSGFMGMRGKKQYDDFGSSSDNSLDWNSAAYENTNDLPYSEARLKKAPSTFYGVRGKKSSNTEEVYRNLSEMLQKVEEEQMRERLLQQFLDRLATRTASHNDIVKRAPTGFTGMRGKRPSMEFYDDLSDNADDDSTVKRAPSNAFVGVRGKKDVKRSPLQSRGKNQRYVDFSNKFVAVRGKKSTTFDDDNVADIVDAAIAAAYADADDNNLSAELTGETHETFNNYNNNNYKVPITSNPTRERFLINMLPSLMYGINEKRTPNGFVGMRGKRAAATYAA